MKTPYRTAHSFLSRLKGRLGENLPSQPLYIPRCKAVHTFGMKFPLHLTWVDRENKVVKQEHAKVNRVYKCAQAYGVIESHLDELKQNQTGQVLVEAAFTIPVLLVIIFGFIQIGLAVHQTQKITYVTHYATQVGAITNDPGKISGAIEEFLDTSQFTLAIESRDGDSNLIADSARQHNDILTVQVIHPFSLQIPLLSVSVLDLKAQASARILCTNPVPPHRCKS